MSIYCRTIIKICLQFCRSIPKVTLRKHCHGISTHRDQETRCLGHCGWMQWNKSPYQPREVTLAWQVTSRRTVKRKASDLLERSDVDISKPKVQKTWRGVPHGQACIPSFDNVLTGGFSDHAGHRGLVLAKLIPAPDQTSTPEEQSAMNQTLLEYTPVSTKRNRRFRNARGLHLLDDLDR